MQENLLVKLTPRLNQMASGAYARVYQGSGKRHPTPTHQLVAELLDSFGLKYEENRRVSPGSALVADFMVGDAALFVERELPQSMLKNLVPSKKYVLIRTDPLRSDRFDHGVRVIQVGAPAQGRLQTIFLDDPSFNFDYAHILPATEKCSVMHGHSTSALVEIVGHPKEGMVVDFGEAKDTIRDAIRSLDHKLFINRKYVRKADGASVSLAFKTVHGPFVIEAPKGTTVLLDGEATVENLAHELLSRIAPKMPSNVTAVGVYVYEGFNKGTHLLAQIHSQEEEKRRKTR